MATVNKITDDFDTFVSKISLNKSKADDIIAKHNTLTDMIKNDPPEGYTITKTRLSGSYAKNTVLNETDENIKPDVDVALIIETKKTDVDEINKDFLKYFKDKKNSVTKDIRQQSNSIGLIYQNISVDMVLGRTDASDNLEITSHKKHRWIQSNALRHVDSMISRNKKYEFNYRSLMKLIKYLNKTKTDSKLKSYTLEMLVHHCVPQPKVGQTLPQVFTETINNMLNIESIYDIKDCYDNSKPGYDEKDVLQFAFFKNEIKNIAEKANLAINGDRSLWEEIFGEDFPKQPKQPVVNNNHYDRTQTPWYDDSRTNKIIF